MRRLHLCLLVLLAVATYAYFAIRNTTDDISRPDDRAAPLKLEAPALLRGVERLPDGKLNDSQPEAAAPDDEPKPASVGAKDMLQVTVRVEGAAGTVRFDPPATLSFQPVMFRIDSTSDFFGVRLKITETGAHALDIAAALKSYRGKRSSRGANIFLSHPDYVPATARIPIPEAGVALDAVDMVLRPAGRLAGRVVDPQGTPLKGATVLLYPMTPEGPDRIPVAEARTDIDGAFQMRYGATGQCLVVATWQQYILDHKITWTGGLRPAHTTIDLVVGKPPTPMVLRMRSPEMIRGRVLIDGVPVQRAYLAWEVAGAGRRLSTWATQDGHDTGGLIYVDNDVHHGWGTLYTDSDGRFVMYGLSPRPYTVAVDSVPHAHVHRMAREALTVTPSHTDVLFDFRLAHIEVLVSHDGVAIPNVELDISAVDMAPDLPEGVVWDTHKVTSDAQGKGTLRVSPKSRYDVMVRNPRYAEFHQQVTTPAAGGVHVVQVELKGARPKPRLLVTLVGEGAEQLKAAGFGFYPPETSRTDGTPAPVRSLKPIDGRFVLDNLFPGEWRLHVRPGRYWNWKPNDWAESTQIVEIAETGDTAVRITIAKGGRLLVTATDVHGRHLDANCKIHDSSGIWIHAWFYAEDLFGGKTMAGDALPGVGPAWIEPALPPGTYTLTFTHADYRDASRRVELTPGKPASVRLVMQPKR